MDGDTCRAGVAGRSRTRSNRRASRLLREEAGYRDDEPADTGLRGMGVTSAETHLTPSARTAAGGALHALLRSGGPFSIDDISITRASPHPCLIATMVCNSAR
jgi:hypothetical protein